MKKKSNPNRGRELLFKKVSLIMKLYLFILVITIMQATASVYSQATRLNLKMENATISEVFDAIEKQSDFFFFYNKGQINDQQRVSVDLKDSKIDEVLTTIFGKNAIKYEIKGKNIIVKSSDLSSFSVQQSDKKITGKVTDHSGLPIPGVSIVVKGTTTGVITDNEGKYTLANVSENTSLKFSFVGMESQEIKVGNQTSVNVVLEEEVIGLEEVVAVGYSTQKKATLTGAVSSIKNEDLVITKNENVVNMLTGKLPGVRVVQKSSMPGAYDTTIDIRGMGTPLFVVDGVPRDQGYFARMDAEEIENISVLKDGAAAIYGLRAANGVVLVTTKSGTSQNGKVDVTFNSSYTVQQFLYVGEGLNAQDYMFMRNEMNWQGFGSSNYLTRNAPLFTQAQMQPYIDGKPSYNWMKAAFRDNTPQQKHSLSVNGGNDKLRYFFNLGYGQQDGSFKTGDLNANSWNVRSNIDAQINNRLKARISLGGIMTENNSPNGSDWSMYKNAWLMRPDAPFYANDNPDYLNGDVIYMPNANILAETSSAYKGTTTDIQRRLNGTLALTYDIPGIKGLSAKGSYDYNMYLADNTQYKKTYTLYTYNTNLQTYNPTLKNSPSSIRRSANINSGSNMQLGMYYVNKFGKHNLNSFLIFEENHSVSDDFAAFRELMVNSQYLFAGETTNQQGTGGTPSDRVTQSVIGQAVYDYNGKYMVDFKFRYDGSSRFPANNRWGFFPTVSAGWRLSEESFIKNNFQAINNLKLRGSYGEMGDDSSAGNYPPTTGYALNGNDYGWYYANSFTGGVAPPGIPNPNLTWYKTKMYNLALDFGYNKLSGTFEVYRRDRTGLLATRLDVVPGTVGASLPQENLNSDRNFGWELSLNYRNKISDFNYFVSPQISATKSMRTDWLETPASNSYDNWRNRTSGRYNNIWWGNESVTQFTTYEQIRNFSMPTGQGVLPGDWYNNDWNGDGIVNGSDDHPIATKSLPVFNFAVSTGVSWKNFDLSMNFQGAAGCYVQFGEVLTEAFPFNGQQTMSYFKDRWHPVDPNADMFNPNTQWISGYYPVTGHDGRRTGTNLVQNSSYVRLKTLEIGYTLPKKLLAKVGVKSLRIYTNGYNLLTWSGLKNQDPERPGANGGGASTSDVQIYNYPVNRTYTLGASLKF